MRITVPKGAVSAAEQGTAPFFCFIAEKTMGGGFGCGSKE